ncbi:peptidylprolyl isomerase [Solimonas sp. K1W22B-7]|uniref:peptidylprolyl isomerase n=1 Tax=Solimonas sp. K1W22B-7 TaxID=2303331 RepID=UPI000E3366F1|nr:peptidylprolyl isomerase [Solimonas sp. K1W22B-7]AXQ31289.1 peptidylprolyl isomerase [Solimonas sp. K1W22B-7]
MKLQKNLYALARAGLIASTAAVAGPAPKGGLQADVLVNGQPISRNHVLLMSEGIDPENKSRRADDANAQAAARAELITQEVLAQEARKQGLDKAPVIADQLAFQNRVILSRAYLEDFFARDPITDAVLKKSYDFKKASGKLVEYKIRHILVQTPEQARDLIGKLDKGEDFVALAKRSTQDPGGQANGGDLGWFRPDIFVDHHFTDAVESLKKGQYSKAAVRTRFGWHVIKVEDGPRPVANPETFEALDDSVKEALRQKTAQIRIEELTARLSAGARISSPATVARRDK